MAAGVCMGTANSAKMCAVNKMVAGIEKSMGFREGDIFSERSV